MAFLKVKNRAISSLASGVSDTDTSWTLAGSEGSKFPDSGDFHVTCEDEIVKCTARSGDVLTVTRAQEGTSAASHDTGKAVELRVTAGVIENIQNEAIVKSLLTTQGDIIQRGASAPERLVIGTAHQSLRVNSGGTGLEYVTGRIFVALETPAPIYNTTTTPVSTTPRTATVLSVASDLITLTANEAYRFWPPSGVNHPDGNMYLKVANTTRSEYAWVKDAPAVNQLQVTASGDISGWQNGDTISTAKDGASHWSIELDISPLIPAGATAILCKLQVGDSGTLSSIKGTALSKESADGTLVWVFAQVSGFLNVAYPVTPIQSNRHLDLRDISSGTDTLGSFVVVLGYYI